jgi:hypothetical protein
VEGFNARPEFQKISNGRRCPSIGIPHFSFDRFFDPGHGDRLGGGKVVQFLPFRKNTTQADGRVAHRHSAGGRL